MKRRSVHFRMRNDPDSLRMLGLRLTANQPPVKSNGPHRSRESKPRRQDERSRSAVLLHDVSIDVAEPFLDCVAAADVLGGLHPKTVERWAREGRIPAYRYCRHWRFRVSELEVWMRSHVNSICHPCRFDKEELDGA